MGHMKRVAQVIGILVALAGVFAFRSSRAPAAPPAATSQATSPVQAAEISTELQDWFDAARQRKIPVKLYLPADTSKPAPVVIFSHGLGGSRLAAAYLLQDLAAHGYVCIAAQHIGSDQSIWQNKKPRDRMAAFQAAANAGNFTDRAIDVRFIIDELERRNVADPVLKGRLDLKNIVMSGHSFGAVTTQAVIGQMIGQPKVNEVTYLDKRITAAVLLSPSESMSSPDQKWAFGNITVPTFHLTGTNDVSAIRDIRAESRRVPFDNITHADRYLIVFKDGDHMLFNGTRGLGPLAGDATHDVEYHKLICQSVRLFVDAYCRSDSNAKRELQAFATTLKAAGTMEHHPAVP